MVISCSIVINTLTIRVSCHKDADGQGICSGGDIVGGWGCGSAGHQRPRTLVTSRQELRAAKNQRC